MLLARRTATGERRTRATLLSAAAAAWLIGQIAWDSFSIAGMPGSPNVADIGYWGFAVLVSIAMLRSPTTSATNRAVMAAENLPLIAAAAALTFSFLWTDASRSSLSELSRVSALVYPALYVSAAILTLQAIVSGSMRRSRSMESLLVFGGIVAQAIAFILWSHQLLLQTYVTGTTILDPLWAFGLIAIGVGGMLASRAEDDTAEVEGPSRHGGILPAAMFGVLIAALAHAYANHVHTTAVIVLVGGLVLCGVSLIARGALLERRLRVLLARERSATASLATREEELARLNERLTEDSRRDPLTGLAETAVRCPTTFRRLRRSIASGASRPHLRSATSTTSSRTTTSLATSPGTRRSARLRPRSAALCARATSPTGSAARNCCCSSVRRRPRRRSRSPSAYDTPWRPLRCLIRRARGGS